MVNADPRLVKVVIRNLIENAVKHSCCTLESIRVSVRDGSGLGLAIVRLIAQLHGGQLQLENLPNGGGRAIFQISRSRVS